MLGTLPWDLALDLPWRVFTPPAEQWASLPSFVVGEYLFIALALLALWHARQNGRAYLLVWLGALVAGTANDMIFMALPLVDNFWQAQATIMLTPRLPLYIPCVYVCFMYLPTVSVWRLGLSPLPRAALTGLVAILLYAPYDIIGAKFLWWTWHDTDLPIASRILGAPIGSTLWVITFAATFAWLMGRVVDKDPQVSGRTFAKGFVLVALTTTVLMMVQMTIVQQLTGGAPNPIGLIGVVTLYAGLTAWGLKSRTPQPRRPSDRPLLIGLTVYFLTLVAVMATFDPQAHVNTSLHQTYGACHVEATDIAGNLRYEFLCAEDFAEDFSFDCVDTLPAAGTQWYTVCGKPHTNKGLWLGGVGGLALAGWLMFGWLLVFSRRAPV